MKNKLLSTNVVLTDLIGAAYSIAEARIDNVAYGS